MTIVKNNALLKGASGKFGDTHVYRTVRGQLQMINTPAKRKKLSPLQKVTVSRFSKAVSYWKSIKKTSPDLVAQYEKRTNIKLFSAYLVAVADHMNAPVVHYIKTDNYNGAIGDILTIKAIDDFKVVRVMVKISDARGKTIEKGEAIRELRKPSIWKYKATAKNTRMKGTTIAVTAIDHPNNEGMLSIVL